MLDKAVKTAKFEQDICEIDNVLNAQIFDRAIAENIIRNHNKTDEIVAIINSPLRQGFVTFEQASDDMVKNNLIMIRQVLQAKLVTEQNNG
ncbi:MAG: hypothetical protein NC184_04780 [Roseburia sp.]|nr:hypothetical protein [Roseburia sp.]